MNKLIVDRDNIYVCGCHLLNIDELLGSFPKLPYNLQPQHGFAHKSYCSNIPLFVPSSQFVLLTPTPLESFIQV